MKYQLDTEKLSLLMAERGIGSLLELSRRAQINRNTILAYFKGRKSPFTSVYTQLAEFLEVPPTHLIRSEDQNLAEQIISDLTTKLAEELKERQLSLMLFGSRARGTVKRSADIDIDISGGANPLTDDEYLSLCVKVDELKENYSMEVDFLNLDRADKKFLSSIRKDLKYIGGDKFAFAYFLGKIDGNQS